MQEDGMTIFEVIHARKYAERQIAAGTCVEMIPSRCDLGSPKWTILVRSHYVRMSLVTGELGGKEQPGARWLRIESKVSGSSATLPVNGWTFVEDSKTEEDK